jgi:hypothetical protein
VERLADEADAVASALERMRPLLHVANPGACWMTGAHAGDSRRTFGLVPCRSVGFHR